MRREFERGFVGGDGLIIFAEPRQYDAQIGMSFGVIGFEFEQRAVFVRRFGELTLLLKLDGAIEFRGRVLGLLKRDQRRNDECQKDLLHGQILHPNRRAAKDDDF